MASHTARTAVPECIAEQQALLQEFLGAKGAEDATTPRGKSEEETAPARCACRAWLSRGTSLSLSSPVVLCCVVLCCAVLCCAVLCCAVLCCAVLSCAMMRCACTVHCSTWLRLLLSFL
jgi:hypothetical protein